MRWLFDFQEADVYMPEDYLTTVTGNCRYEDTETMTLVFKGFKLIWDFAKVSRVGVAKLLIRRATFFINYGWRFLFRSILFFVGHENLYCLPVSHKYVVKGVLRHPVKSILGKKFNIKYI